MRHLGFDRAGDGGGPPHPHRHHRRQRRVSYGADAPFGGYKASGIGRQNGIEGFEQYLETKTISGPAPAEG